LAAPNGGVYRGANITVTVDGLNQLRRGLGTIGKEARMELVGGLRDIAKETSGGIRTRMRSDFGGKPRRKGDRVRATSAVTQGVSGTTAWVGYHSRNRYVGWLDFGGTLRPTGGRRNTIYRPIIREGRYLYPELTEARRRNIDNLARLLDGLIEKHTPR
jgi:hypothetical protein